LNGIPGDDDFGDNGNGDPDDLTTPMMKSPTTPITEWEPRRFRTRNSEQSADAIAALARTFNIKETALERKSRPRTPSMEQTQPNSAHSSSNYNSASTIDLAHSLKITEKSTSPSLISRASALAHFENSLVEPDLINPPGLGDDYREFVLELNTYFGALDVVGEAETKLEKPIHETNSPYAKYIVEFNRLSTLTGWDNRALRHQFYRGLPARIKDEVSRVGKPDTLPALRTLALS